MKQMKRMQLLFLLLLGSFAQAQQRYDERLSTRLNKWLDQSPRESIRASFDSLRALSREKGGVKVIAIPLAATVELGSFALQMAAKGLRTLRRRFR